MTPKDIAARALSENDPAILDQLLALPQAHLVVDGYNVTKTGYPQMPLEKQRLRLLGQLSQLAAQTGAEVTCVFDGAELAAPVLLAPPRGVRVLFSKAGRHGGRADPPAGARRAARPAGHRRLHRPRGGRRGRQGGRPPGGVRGVSLEAASVQLGHVRPPVTYHERPDARIGGTFTQRSVKRASLHVSCSVKNALGDRDFSREDLN